MRTLKQFVAEGYELERYGGKVEKAHGEAIETGRTQALFDSAVHVGAKEAVLCVLSYKGSMVLEGEITARALTGFLIHSLFFSGECELVEWDIC